MMSVAAALLFLASMLPGPNVPAARHKTGPSTIRGVALRVTRTGFQLRTSHGTYTVQLFGATTIDEKGVRGKATLRNGDHVGVRGFVQGATIRAMRVRIYPSTARPKAYTVEGTVEGVSGNALALSVAGRVVRAILTSGSRIRIGSRSGSARDLRAGQRVKVRLQPGSAGTAVVDMHVYSSKAVLHHLRLQGTVVSISGSRLTLRSGSSVYVLTVPGSARMYGSGKLAAGRQVTVYACCTGRPLVATSIHLAAPKPPRAARVEGFVTAVGPSSLTVSTSRGPATVGLSSGTTYSVGDTPSRGRNVLVGDRVSIRAEQWGRGLGAVSVHVDALSRQPRTVTGSVVAVGGGTVTVLDRGARVVVTIGRGTRAAAHGHPANPMSVRIGDRVSATGRRMGPQSIAAATMVITPRVAPAVLLRGTVTGVQGGVLTVTDEFGVAHRVQLSGHTAVNLGRTRASAALLAKGARVTVRGVQGSGGIVASSVVESARARTLHGRVLSTAPSLTVTSAGGVSVVVRPTPGVMPTDGGRSASLQRGTYVVVSGWEIAPGSVVATSIRVAHPRVALSGMVLRRGGTMILQTSSGSRYTLRLTPSSRVSTGREAVSLRPSAIPAGAHLHVTGAIAADGSVSVATVAVRLRAVSLRGKIATLGASALTLSANGAITRVKLGPRTTVAQGSHPLVLGDVVVGDDATVDGYDGGPGVILARKVLVHRRLLGLTGVVVGVNAGGFVLNAADGQHTVILTAGTLVSPDVPSPLSAGLSVHVTGYLRGDGSILATRLRLGSRGRHPKGTPTPALQP